MYCALYLSYFVAIYLAFSTSTHFLYLALYIFSPIRPLQVFVACKQTRFLALRYYLLLGCRQAPFLPTVLQLYLQRQVFPTFKKIAISFRRLFGSYQSYSLVKQKRSWSVPILLASTSILVNINKMIDVKKIIDESIDRYDIRKIDDYYQVYDNE